MTEYTTIFELGNIGATQQSSSLVLFIIGGTIALILGVGIVIARKFGKMQHVKRHVGPFFIVFGIGWLSATPSTLSYWDRVESFKDDYASKNYETTEGIVRVLRTQPEHGHAPGDLIKVGTREFEVNYFTRTPGYKLTLSHNGRLAEGVKVRLSHIDNTILKIEVVENY
jgi:hypothetical protein